MMATMCRYCRMQGHSCINNVHWFVMCFPALLCLYRVEGRMKMTQLCDMEISYFLIPQDMCCHIPLWRGSAGNRRGPDRLR